MSGFRATIGAAVLTLLGASISHADDPVETGACPLVNPRGYDHNRYGVSGNSAMDFHRCFAAFESGFDSLDDDDGDGDPDVLRVPHWVAQEVKKTDMDVESGARPSSWFTDKDLAESGIAAKDESYRYSKAWLDEHPDWFQRGHLAQKYLAERIDAAAAYNTHTLLNAVPQRARFNAGIWLDIECKSGAWANRFGRVWIISGPVFLLGRPNDWIGEREKREKLVAVPDALFKVIIREGKPTGTPPKVLAFLYPQTHPSYAKGPYDHTVWLTSIARIQALTDLTFFEPGATSEQAETLSDEARDELISAQAEGLWPYEDEDFDPGCSKNRQ